MKDGTVRAHVYKMANDWLLPNGLMSVHPKHTIWNEPDRYFSCMTPEYVCREIESAGYLLQKRLSASLWPGHGTVTGEIWNFAYSSSGRQETKQKGGQTCEY